MTKLYNITEKYRSIADLLEYDYAEDLNIKDTLRTIEEEFDEKALNIAKIILENRAAQETVKTEIERLKKKLNSLELNEKWLKDYLLTEMTAIKKDSIKDAIISIRIQKVQPSVEVIDENEIPQDFIRIIPAELKADKKAIIQHFKDTGEILSGVDIITNRRTVVIR